MTGAEQPLWLLMDVPGGCDLPESLRGDYPDVQLHGLLENTSLHSLHEQGPQLLRLDRALSEVVHGNPDEWPGLFLQSSLPVESLLDHLRQMLTVRFGEHYEGVLSYYNPQTASYFFDASDASELSRWLGPIRLLYWYGGTWADKAIGSLGWQQLANPGLATSVLGSKMQLSLAQQNRLQECIFERHAFVWSQSSGHKYSRIWRCLQEGLSQGFRDTQLLDGWLNLRMLYPFALFPTSLLGSTPAERLDNLRQYWEGNQEEY